MASPTRETEDISRNPRLTAAVVVFVRDVERVTAFYRELASMTVVSQAPSHSLLTMDGFELTIHAMRGAPEVPSSPDGAVEVREDSCLKVCLPVESIDLARTLAKRLGGGIKGTEHEWEARGFRACDGHDPEGNVLQVREPTLDEGSDHD